jgi:hypothetical protein
LGVLAVAALSAHPLQAQTATIVLNNYNCTDWQNPNATTNGLLWIDPGTGLTLLPITQDVNLDIEVNTPTGWQEVGNGPFLLSQGATPITGGTNPGDPAYDGQFYVDGGNPVPIPGGTHAGPYQFQIFAWTGSYVDPSTPYNSYTDAVNGAAIVGTSGVFEEQAAPAGGVDFGTSYNYGFLDMPAIVMKPSLPGDANLDGRVDINDLTIVLTNYGQTGMTWTQGDFTDDGKVDINDLTIVLTRYGQTVASAGAGSNVSAVPEPSTLLLLGLALAAPAVCFLRAGWTRLRLG